MSNPGMFHERLESQRVTMGSSRSFGLVFAVVFAAIGAYWLWKGREAGTVWIVLGLGFGTVALVRPQLLQPLNAAWFRVGMLLGKVVTPVVMLAVFAVAVVPTALVMRISGKDPLRLKWDRKASSYWIARTPPGPAPDMMRHQF
jgi:hypothetical protein